jgi:6-phosphogluconate dehydrogenase
MDVFSECETLRSEFNKLADKHNVLVTENLKLKSQLEYKAELLDFIKSIQQPERVLDIVKSVRPQMEFTLVKRVSRTHAK